MTYSVKEIYYTLQGEGTHTGRPAVFLRFAGCNLWTGREQHRADAICRFCDTEFVGTDGPGGEPLLQLDRDAIDALHDAGFEIGVETNGTIDAPRGIDWLCVSPKGRAPVRQRSGDELKLVFPQVEAEAQPGRFDELEFDHFYLQPLDDAELEANTRAAIDFCLGHPQWQLSLQTHKLLGID